MLSSRLANIPDGRYGFFVEFTESYRLVNSFMYEFYYTKNQSRFGDNKNIPENYFTMMGIAPAGPMISR
ncbi:hypothetical protein LZ575_12655 [Antarcticibacterium sp. 1MA-6-2]|uniref:hypothetical protein n=1 Tax=Antarcticibacterium sp. 1MA-6-2 TaxID=2908210 RepID=UPI001F1AD9C7|nr:hypothetical protein [Antarcticibacterium sp. 1MA-6-2]UJH89850.1 hypothetical protein LZ575_12655 [Antarcticibacterium sp. 1MA-6-2]